MRVGVLSDVHGNLFALQATLDALRGAGVDGLVCAGDLVGYGPQPNECVETVAELGMPSVAGNHDLMAIGLLSDDRCVQLARDSQQWTRRVLRDDVRKYLADLPPKLALGALVVAHGSLDDPQEYVLSETRASEQLAQLAREHPDAAVLVLGHTHLRWIYVEGRGTVRVPRDGQVPLDPAGRYLLNPGSVGQSRQREWRPRARCMIVDLRRWTVECHSVDYDVGACRQALRAHGLPRASIHVTYGFATRAARRATRLLRNTLRPS